MRPGIAVVLLLLTSVCLHAAIVPGTERPVAPPSVGASFAPTRLQAVVTDGTDFLTLWSENEPGRDGLYATFVRENGARNARVPRPAVRGKVSAMRAVWTDDAYLVIAVVDGVQVVLRLDREGNVLEGPAPFALEQWGGGLAWNGAYALATTWDFAAKRSTATLLDAHGRVVRGGIELPFGTNYHSAVAAGGAFVVFTTTEEERGTRRVEAVRVTNDGSVSEPLTILEQQALVSHDFAVNGGRVGIVVRTQPVAAGAAVTLHRFTLDAASMSLEAHAPLAIPAVATAVEVVPSPGGFTASWGFVEAGKSGKYLGSIAFDETAPRTLTVPEFMAGHLMASNGRNAFAVWHSAPLHGAAFDAEVTSMTSGVLDVTAAGVKQNVPSVAVAPESTLVAWTENAGPDKSDVMVRRFDRAGNALGEPLRIAANAWPRGTTAATFTGRVWLVAWQVGFSAWDMRIAVRRLALDGTPLDAQPLDAGPGWYPALASNGSVTLLGLTTEEHKAMAAIRFAPDGERLDAQPVVVFPDRGYGPELATNGRELLMVWESRPVRGNHPHGIIGVRFDESGALLDPAPILIATESYSEIDPHAASDGTDFLVVYSRARRIIDGPPPPPETLHVKRVLRTGVLADATAAQPGPSLGDGRDARVAPLGAGYVITFARGSEGSAVTLHAVRVDARGTPLDGIRELPNGESYTPEHALVPVGNAVLVAYPRAEPALANVQRVYLRTIGEEAPPRRRAVRR